MKITQRLRQLHNMSQEIDATTINEAIRTIERLEADVRDLEAELEEKDIMINMLQGLLNTRDNEEARCYTEEWY